MLHLLDKYKKQGVFTFSIDDKLSQVCNAPRNASGIYIIYIDEEDFKNIVYIGISGRNDGLNNIIHRQGGMYDRIVNGKQFGDRRKVTWPLEMEKIGINEIIIHWYETHGEDDRDFPRPIEIALLELFKKEFDDLPLWNNEI